MSSWGGNYGPPSAPPSVVGVGTLVGVIIGMTLLTVCVAAITFYATKRRYLIAQHHDASLSSNFNQATMPTND